MQLKLCQREGDVSSSMTRVLEGRSRTNFFCLPGFPDQRGEAKVEEKLQSALQVSEV